MVKAEVNLKGEALERKVRDELYALLTSVPGLEVDRNPTDPQLLPSEPEPDVRFRVFHKFYYKNETVANNFDLIAEVKSVGQPRIAQAAIFHLRKLATAYNTPLLLVFTAPFLSQEVRDLCKQEDIGYFDLAGNVRIAINGLYIEREASDNPFKEVRENRSLFAPKAARILRAMFWDVQKPWRVAPLAEAAGVSFGQVSNITTALVDAGFAEKTDSGVIISEPAKLLDAWRKAYKLPEGRYEGYYTPLHGTALAKTLRDGVLCRDKEKDGERLVLANTSAAAWLAPYVRAGTDILYSNARGLERLKSRLDLKRVEKGYNVLVKILDDEGPLDDAFQVADGIWSTSPVQTYLDLSNAGDRNQEGAEVLKEKWFPWY